MPTGNGNFERRSSVTVIHRLCDVRGDRDLDSKDQQHREGNADGPGQAVNPEQALENPSRRRFSRAAVAGSAVIFSLGNRAAWGQGGDVVGCMSLMTVNSFNPATGMFISAPAGERPGHDPQLAAAIHEIGDAPDFQGVDLSGEFRVCEDPASMDNVCLVRGDCPQL